MGFAGKQFWTWISVAVISVFVKSESDALAQQKAETTTPSSSSHIKPGVPAGSHPKTGVHQDMRMNNSNPTVYSMGKGEQKKWKGKNAPKPHPSPATPKRQPGL
jgi:hypothetical protein